MFMISRRLRKNRGNDNLREKERWTRESKDEIFRHPSEIKKKVDNRTRGTVISI